MAARRRKKQNKTVYKTITFKLTVRQRKSLWNFCKARKTTPTKLIKKVLRPYTENYSVKVPDEYYITENQLDMFDEIDELAS